VAIKKKARNIWGKKTMNELVHFLKYELLTELVHFKNMWTELWTSSCRKWTFPTL